MVQKRTTRKRKKKKKKFTRAKRSKYKWGKVNPKTRQTLEEYKFRKQNNKSLMQRGKIVNCLASYSQQVTGIRFLRKFTKKKKKRTRLEEHERECIKPNKYGDQSEKEGNKHDLVFAKLLWGHKTVVKSIKWKKRKQKHSKQKKKIRGSFSMDQLQCIVMQNRKKLAAKMNRGTYIESLKKPLTGQGVRRKRKVTYVQVRRIKGCSRVKCCWIVLNELLMWEIRVKKKKKMVCRKSSRFKYKHTKLDQGKLIRILEKNKVRRYKTWAARGLQKLQC